MDDTSDNDTVANTGELPKEIQAMQDRAMKAANLVERLRAF